MGGGQSRNAGDGGGLVDLEVNLRGSGDLAILERCFQHLSISSSELDKKSSVPLSSLQECFGLAPLVVKDTSGSQIAELVDQIGPAIVQELFGIGHEDIGWIHILQGYQRFVQNSSAERLKSLVSVFTCAKKCLSRATGSAGTKKVADGKADEDDDVGFLAGAELQGFLYLCWLFMCHTRLPARNDAVFSGSELQASLPKLDHVLSGAFRACDVSKSKEKGSSEQTGSETEFSVGEISSWVFAAIPSLADCLVQYVRAQLDRVPTVLRDHAQEKQGRSPISQMAQVEEVDEKRNARGGGETMARDNSLLLHAGTAWAVGNSTRDSAAAEILLRAACGLINTPGSEFPNIIYRSSVHGRGMNRLWTCVLGYRAPVLVLISAHSKEGGDSSDIVEGHKIVLGALITGGLDNKESFYGGSGSCLYSIDPVFCPFRSSGREKNFVYSHKRTPGAVYRSTPAAEGVGFGGCPGKERVWLDEDFGTLIVRHHAVDKTYNAGSLIPNQGFSAVTANVLEVEIWGLGGDSAEQEQTAYLKRENLFSEQRRKVDLASFGNWENSPEKMMMDMMGNPSAARREER